MTSLPGWPEFTDACRVVWGPPCAAAATESFPYAGHGWHRSQHGGGCCRSSGQNSSCSPESWSRMRSPSSTQETQKVTVRETYSVVSGFDLNFSFWISFVLFLFPPQERCFMSVMKYCSRESAGYLSYKSNSLQKMISDVLSALRCCRGEWVTISISSRPNSMCLKGQLLQKRVETFSRYQASVALPHCK